MSWCLMPKYDFHAWEEKVQQQQQKKKLENNILLMGLGRIKWPAGQNITFLQLNTKIFLYWHNHEE